MPRFPKSFPLHTGLIVALGLFLIVSCAGKRTADRLQPGTSEITLWANESISLDPDWRHLDTDRLTVRGTILDSSLIPMDRMETLIFTRPAGNATAILLLSKVVKNGITETFRYLGGNKIEVDGLKYRETRHGLDVRTTDTEYARYFAAVSQAGLPLAPNYAVKVLDRLPLDTVLVRIMELTPGEGTHPLPPYGELYLQERKELLRRHFF